MNLTDSRLVLIGQAPTKDHPTEAFPTCAASTKRLAAFAEVPLSNWCLWFECYNLIPEWVGKEPNRRGTAAGAADAFDWVLARQRAAELEPWFAGRKVVVVGARVARCFGLTRYPSMHTIRSATKPWSIHGWIPHPSGLSRFWNEPLNAMQASAFLYSMTRLPA